MTNEEIIKKYEKMLVDIINPGNMTWDDLGFDEAPEKEVLVYEWLKENEHFDEGEQISISLIEQFIYDLKPNEKQVIV